MWHKSESRRILLMGLDVGTTSAKGLVVTPKGKIVASAREEYLLQTPQPGWAEQNPEDWWRASGEVIRTLLSSVAGADIAAVGLSGQMHGAVFLDAEGAPIRPAILWNDARTSAECLDIEERIGCEQLRKIAGNPALTGFQAPKVLWLERYEPGAYRRLRYLLLPKDYVRYRLSGNLATDTSDAAGTLLFDLERRDWSAEILKVLKIERSWLPRVYESPEITGHVSEEGGRASGLAMGTPIVAGAGDNAAAAVGAGVIYEGSALLSLGTSGVIFTPSKELRIDPSGALQAFCHAVPGTYHLMGVILSAGGSLRWYRDLLQNAAQGLNTGAVRIDYDTLLAGAEGVAAGAKGLFFLPYLSGERTPHMDPDARGAWIGLSLAHGPSHLTRAVLEGVAFALKDALVRIRSAGVMPTELRSVGGGVSNPLWRQILADVLGVPLLRMEVEEGPAFGAALLAGVGVGVFASVEEAVSAAVRIGPATQPDRASQAVYEELYHRYAQIYPALQAGLIFAP